MELSSFKSKKYAIFPEIEFSSLKNKKIHELTSRPRIVKKKNVLKKFIKFWEIELSCPKNLSIRHPTECSSIRFFNSVPFSEYNQSGHFWYPTNHRAVLV